MQLTVPSGLGPGVQPPGPAVPGEPEHAAMLCVLLPPAVAASEPALQLACASDPAHCASPPPACKKYNTTTTNACFVHACNQQTIRSVLV